jgi:hypothetical protein
MDCICSGAMLIHRLGRQNEGREQRQNAVTERSLAGRLKQAPTGGRHVYFYLAAARISTEHCLRNCVCRMTC